MAEPASSVPGPAPMLLFGGTFDPPHFAHLFVAASALQHFGAERVIFLPAGDPYLKRARRSAEEVRGGRAEGRGQSGSSLVPSPASHRLAMLRLAVAGNPRFVIDDREVRRAGPTYTVDTLEEVSTEYRVPSTESTAHSGLGTRHSELLLVLGSDAVAELPHWRNPERILELARIAEFEKPRGVLSAEPSVLSPQSSALIARIRERVIRIPGPELAISSTLVRERVAAGLPIRYLVPDAVAAYIAEQGLYRA